MSWLIDLAGKAEHYLDKIDQNTAVVLQNQKEKPLKDVFKTPVSENVSIEIDCKPIVSVPSSPSTKSKLKKPKNDSRISDEHLLEYLNSHDSTIQSQYGMQSSSIDNSIDPISVPLTEENHLLKNEIRTLNNEMSLLQYKLKTADKDIIQISMELEVNKRHSANLEKELQEAQIQLRNAQDVMFRLKEKSKTRDPVTEENSFVCDNNLINENQMLKNEISTLLKKIDVDELKKNDLAAEKLNLEMALNNIQFESKNTVKKEQFVNLSNECDTITAVTKTNLNNVAQKLKECLNGLEIVTNIQSIADQGVSNTSEEEHSDIMTKLNVMKSNLLSIDCGLQKSLHDLSGFKERLLNIDSESSTENTNFNNHTDLINQGVMNEQMLSLKKAVACKQAELDQILAEKSSMAIRIERLEMRLKKETNVLINVNDTDDAKAKVPYFMLENAFDTSVGRRVKRAYTSLDSFGLRTGMYLRRYPLLRTILFVYVVSIFHYYIFF
ncbi:Hypothetical protein CINCED_3A011239 [Cinara cedri]|uniref:Uncharacterized protein n=1 Tax=Cinara cedri TaxID=506608 RepID=A0A5E4N9L8_9HEMI|nr:Hypothetical protein CINCED_3A011239 [Cinara cedri]